jgi:hypothetical protein
MPDLSQSLHGFDLGGLHVIAELWGLKLEAPDVRRGRKNLARILLNAEFVAEVVEALPRQAQEALGDLKGSEGRMPWTQFTHRYGVVREMGPGRRDREKPHRTPTSTSEILWYRALVARAFFDTDTVPQEFAYIPDDLIPLLPPTTTEADFQLSRPSSPKERAHVQRANDHILDWATTLLAALRLGFEEEDINQAADAWGMPPAALTSLLKAADLLDAEGQPAAEEIRSFLEAPRGEALARLVKAWLSSAEHNDLRLIPHLRAEGEWHNDPNQTRRTVLDLLNRLDSKTWWSLPAFVSAMYNHRPDFQRPAGEYDSWYLRDLRTGEYLRGFEHWQAVDGALLRYLVTGPLHWLGLLDLAAPDEDSPPIAFRFSPWREELLSGKSPTGIPLEEEKLNVDSKGLVSVPRLAPRAIRYQVARFCEWEGRKRDAYTYRITPASLTRAQEQGLQVTHLLTLLRGNASSPLPPNVVQALERWKQHGTQVHLESMLVLRVNHPKVLEKLRKSRAARFLGEPLGPTTITVKPGARQKVVEALAEMGYLSEIDKEDED